MRRRHLFLPTIAITLTALLVAVEDLNITLPCEGGEITLTGWGREYQRARPMGKVYWS